MWLTLRVVYLLRWLHAAHDLRLAGHQVLLAKQGALLPGSGSSALASCGLRPLLWKRLVAQAVEAVSVNGDFRRDRSEAEQWLADNEVDLPLQAIDIVLIKGLQPRLTIIVESSHRFLAQLRLGIQALG